MNMPCNPCFDVVHLSAAIRADVAETRQFAAQHGGLGMVYIAPDLPHTEQVERNAENVWLELIGIGMESRP